MSIVFFIKPFLPFRDQLPEDLDQRVRRLPIERLKELGKALFDFRSLQDLQGGKQQNKKEPVGICSTAARIRPKRLHPFINLRRTTRRGCVTMNPHKIRTIIDHIQSQGGLPTDAFGNILSADDPMAWFGLNDILKSDEQERMKAELGMMAEAELLDDQLKSQQ